MFGINDGNRKWWVLAAMGGVLALIVLDETSVGVALPTIRDDLAMSQITAHWVLSAYLLALTAFAAASGKFSDIFGRRNIFMVGIALFGIGSVASGFAQNGTWIVSARVVQGLGASIIFPSCMAMITAVFPPNERGLAYGIQTLIGGVFISLGPLVGGFFTQELSWRWIFWFNLPLVICIALVVIAAWVEPTRDQTAKQKKIDYPGLVMLIIGLGALVLGIMEAPNAGWASLQTIGLLIGGVVVMIAFVFVELRTDMPMIAVGLFRHGTFSSANLVIFTGEFTRIAIVIFGAMFLQIEYGMSPLDAGIAMVPAAIPSLFTAIPAGRLADRFGARWLALPGLLANAAVMLWIAYVVHDHRYDLLVPAFVIWSATLPFQYGPIRRAVMNTVSEDQHGQAGGVNVTAQQLGGTVGMTVCGTIYATTGDFQSVYWATGGLAVLVLIIGFFALKNPPRSA